MKLKDIDLAYIFLYFSMPVLLVTAEDMRLIPSMGFVLSLSCGYLNKRVKPVGIFFLLLYGGLLYESNQREEPSLRLGYSLAAIMLNIMISLHKAPGFSNQQVFENVMITENAVPYNLYLNFDKTLAGMITLMLMAQRPPPISAKMLASTAITTSLTTLVVICAAFMLGYVKLDISPRKHFPLWALTNLLFVCPAEEACFRALILGKLEPVCGNWPALGISSLLFGLAHYSGGIKYVGLATLAGIGYGYAYQKTGNITSSILTHFFVNFFHFCCFTYPALRSDLSPPSRIKATKM